MWVSHYVEAKYIYPLLYMCNAKYNNQQQGMLY